MNIQEIIDKQFNPHNFSKVDLHELFSVFLKNNALIYKNEEVDNLNSFNKHPLITSIIDWSKKNNIIVSINSIDGLGSRRACIISNTASIQNITVRIPNNELIIRYAHVNEGMEGNFPSLMISYALSGNYTKEISFNKKLNSTLFIHVNDKVQFQFQSSSDIIENNTTTHKTLKHIPFNSTSIKEQTEANEVFSLIMDSIVKKIPLKEALEIASIQYDFSNKKLINQITYFFETNQEIEKHCQLAYYIKKMKPSIKLKTPYK